MSHPDPSPRYSPWPHRVAVVLCCATFPLVWVGGLVTTYDAGMAVPDWPTTYGYNLLLYPWQTWVLGPFDLFIEHGHRLLGAAVGLLSILLAVVTFVAERREGRTRSKLVAAAVGALGLVSAQGLLGGLRVQLDARGLAMLHGCLGLATFGYLCAMTVVTSRSWRPSHLPQVTWPQSSPRISRLPRLALLTSGLVYLQIVFGAFLRHVPVGAPHQFFRLAVLFHLLVAVGVVVHVFLWWRVLNQGGLHAGSAEAGVKPEDDRRHRLALRSPVAWLMVLVSGQVVLGLSTWVLKYGWPTWFADQWFAAGFTIEANSLLQATVTTAHVAMGALIFGTSVIGSLRTWRFFQSAMTAGSSVLCMGWTT